MCTSLELDTHVGSKNLLSVKLENQTQHAVRGRVLRTKVDSEVTERAVSPGAALAKDLLCGLVVELLDGVGRGGGRGGDRFSLGGSILGLSGERATCSGREKAARSRGCARAVELSSRTNGAEEGGRHDECKSCEQLLLSGGGWQSVKCDRLSWCRGRKRQMIRYDPLSPLEWHCTR